jgi:hypothetical protein
MQETIKKQLRKNKGPNNSNAMPSWFETEV